MAITDGLITLEDVRKSLGLAATDTSNDADLERYVEAATPVIENITGPLIQRTEVFYMDGGREAIVLPKRFTSVTSITQNGVAYTSYVADPGSGVITAGTSTSPDVFEPGVRNVVVTVVTGSATIPSNVQLAARELVRFWWQQGRQANIPAFGEAPESGVTPMGFAVPKRVMELLEPNKRIAGFA